MKWVMNSGIRFYKEKGLIFSRLDDIVIMLI